MSSFTDTEQRDLMESLKLVFLYTFGVEAAGATVLTILFHLHDGELLPAFQQGVFTAVSGFCNAGFTICSGNLTVYRDAPLLLYTVGILIVLGGIAPATAVLLPNYLRGRTVPVGAHLALVATAWLIGIGTLAFLVFEWNGVLAGLSPAAKFHNAVFQSVTLRTAGFNSVDLGGLHSSTVLISLIWMFIGGSPGGTAGGVKTTTVAVMALVRLLDRCGLLPRALIDLSPFHTSMFITNLASINTTHIFHHVYEFGTTSVFLSVGKSIPNYLTGDLEKKLMPISVVMDERICTGHDYALFNKTLQRYLKNPELLEKENLPLAEAAARE